MTGILNTNQVLKARIFLKENEKHIYNIILKVKKGKPPTYNPDYKDKSYVGDLTRPTTWEKEHWRWFIDNEL